MFFKYVMHIHENYLISPFNKNYCKNMCDSIFDWLVYLLWYLFCDKSNVCTFEKCNRTNVYDNFDFSVYIDDVRLYKMLQLDSLLIYAVQNEQQRLFWMHLSVWIENNRFYQSEIC